MGHYFLSLSYIHLYPQIHSCLNLDVSCNLSCRGRHTTSASKLAWIAPTCHHYHRLDICCRFKVFCEGKKWLFSFCFFHCTCREGQKFSFCHSKTDTSWGEQLPMSWWQVRFWRKGLLALELKFVQMKEAEPQLCLSFHHLQVIFQ